jgi:hypothetical protein
MRPVLRHRKARVVTDALDRAQFVVVGQFGENRPVGRRRETIRVGEVNDVFQLRLSPFCFCFLRAGRGLPLPAIRHRDSIGSQRSIQ